MIIKFEGKEKFIKTLKIRVNYRQGLLSENELAELVHIIKWEIEKKMCIVNSIEIEG
jgi:hypothetical protein